MPKNASLIPPPQEYLRKLSSDFWKMYEQKFLPQTKTNRKPLKTLNEIHHFPVNNNKQT